MEKKSGHTDIREFIGVLLEDNRQLQFRMKGYSMFPYLRPGDRGTVQKCTAAELKPGDIIVFYLQSNLVAHRFLHREGEFLTAKGDNNFRPDSPVPVQQLVGKLIAMERNGKEFAMNRQNLTKVAALRMPRILFRINNLLYQLHTGWNAARQYYSDFRANFKLAVSPVRSLFALTAGISVFQGLLPFLLILLVKWLVDLLISLPGKSELPPQFILILTLTGFAFLLSSVLSELKGLYGEKLSQAVIRSVYQRLHQKHGTLGLSEYENPSQLDKIHRAVQEASFRPVKLLNEVQHLLRSIAASLFLVGIFISIRWYMVLILIVAIAPGILTRIRFARRYHRLKDKQSPLERKMYYFNRVLTGVAFAKEMKLFGFSRFFVKRFREIQSTLFKDKLNLRRSEVLHSLITQLFAVLLVFCTLAMVSWQTLHGMYSIGTVVLFFFAFQRGYSVLNDLFRLLANLLDDTLHMNDFREFAESTGSQTVTDNREATEKAPPAGITQTLESRGPAFSLKEAIRIENLSFRYENSKRDALQSVNLTIHKGETVAIVGANGSGKTTLIKLLCGFYLPASGRILYDQISTAELGYELICSNLSAVFQDFALYNVTANENIALGDIDRSLSASQVEAAAGMAGIGDVLQQLPDGYKTLLGNQFLGGEELSTGQWQKLAIARAFYRDRELLLMDEPSSALDAASEQQIIETLKKLAHRKTALIISHRLSTVRWADRIVVLDQGRLVEEGTHEDLIRKNGTYAYLYQQATRSYEDQP